MSGASDRWRRAAHGIYVVLDAGVTADLAALLEEMLAAGIRVIQYRAKSGVDGTLAARLAVRTQETGGCFLVNDDLATALAIPEAGLHVGQEDLAMHDAAALRAVLAGRVLGVSSGTAAEARAAEALGADYVGVGPVAATSTKRDAGAAIGEAGLRAVASAVAIPSVAIGGIERSTIPLVVRAGAAMAAVVTAVARDPQPRRAAERLVAAWSAASGA